MAELSTFLEPLAEHLAGRPPESVSRLPLLQVDFYTPGTQTNATVLYLLDTDALPALLASPADGRRLVFRR